MRKHTFPLGRFVATPAALQLLAAQGQRLKPFSPVMSQAIGAMSMPRIGKPTTPPWHTVMSGYSAATRLAIRSCGLSLKPTGAVRALWSRPTSS
jgi:hypothetical protein